MKNTLLLGTRKGLVVYKKETNGWEFHSQHFLGIPVTYAIKNEHNGIWWACLDHGHWGCKMHWSKNEGATWQEIEAPKYPEGEVVKDEIPAKLEYIWSLAFDGEKIYVGTIPGGLFVSEKAGDDFKLVEGLWNHPSRQKHWFGGGFDHAGIHSIIIDSQDSNRILVGISCAGVFETTDGGNTWEVRNKGLRADFLPEPDAEVGQDPHIVVAAPSNPDVLWQQNHCGIFRSTNGARSWEEITENGGPAKFGFAIAVDENDADTAWVVPAVSDEVRVAVDTALCVCHTEDGGKSWTALRNGLQQENCFDITFRHALDITGNTLAFGTTNGNLYLSEDRGGDWHCWSNHLSPVYSVRFV